MTARCVMVLGTSSGAGKSWIATALCRHYARQGLRVAPFKAQNMSNNARVVAAPGGGMGEMGSAQYFQALAARRAPDVRMNPLLLKPEADTQSQVVLMGQARRDLSALPWRERSAHVWPAIAAALDALRAENDVVVIEGAGSPAEINLMASDVVNLRVARHADARCLLVADIDRGGAFAHLYGTWALLAPEDRARIAGFVLNKFRGDAALLAPAPQALERLTGVPTVAVVPLLRGHGLPEEDGLAGGFDDGAQGLGFSIESAASPRQLCVGSYQKESVRASEPAGTGTGTGMREGESTSASRVGAIRRIAIVAAPHLSNLDEFQPLAQIRGVECVWARSAAALAGADTIVLPGSKSTVADLAWLRARGMDAAVCAHAAAGGRVLGICGGLQMLGEALIDTEGVEPGGSAPGLGLVPLATQFAAAKTLRRTRFRFGDVAGAWRALAGVEAEGYEIHCGQTAPHPALAARDGVREPAAGIAWQSTAGNVLGYYVHGLFEDTAVLRALFGADVEGVDAVFERLADALEKTCGDGVLGGLAQPRPNV